MLEGILIFPEKKLIQVSPAFQKFIPLCFHERPMLVRIFTNQKKSQEDFAFMKKGKR